MRFLVTLILSLLVSLTPSWAEQVVPQNQAQIKLSFAPIVEQTAPAVVNVYARSKVEVTVSPFANDPFFRQFFGNNLPGQRQQRFENSLGSGVIVDPRGFIVTNNHVVANATDVRVALSDRREFDAKILLADARTDLAVLKIEPPEGGFKALNFADSDNLSVGDLVLAIGNPFGIGQTVTSGIVSALARSDGGIGDAGFFIQTDAAINPGNSGGALVNMNGDLVGINSAILSKTGGSVGIGFAIPANMVRTVVHAAENGGKFIRPWMGATIQEITPDIGESLGLPTPDGGLVLDLDPESPLAIVGIKRGDVIVAVDGQHIAASRELIYRIVSKPMGSKVNVTYLRDGKENTATITLIGPPENPPRELRALSGPTPFNGATIANISPAIADELQLPLPDKGVVIFDAGQASGARFFTKGDVIGTVNGMSIRNTDDLAKLTAKRQPGWEIVVLRQGKPLRIRLPG